MKKLIASLILTIFASLWGQSTLKIDTVYVRSATGATQCVGVGCSPTFANETVTGTTTAAAANFSGIMAVNGAAADIYNFVVRNGTNQNIGFRSLLGLNQIESVNDARNSEAPLRFDASIFSFMSGNVNVNSITDLGKTLGVNGTFEVTGATTLATSLNGCLTATSGVVSSTGSACGSGGSVDSTFGALFLTNSSRGPIHWRNNDSLYWDSANTINVWSKGLKAFGDIHATGNVVSDNGVIGVNVVGSGTVSSGSSANILQGDGSGSLANSAIIWPSDGSSIQGPNTGLDIGNQGGAGAFGFTRICGADSLGIEGACIMAQGSAYGGLGNGGSVAISLPSTGSAFPQFSIGDANYGTNPIFAYNQFGDNGITIEAQTFNISSTSGNILAWSDGNPFEVESPFQMDGNIQATVMIGSGNSGWCTDATGNAYRGTLVTVATIANVLTCP